ncbi:hypothetical protein AVEN_145080-1 [Araneus ventricosus]|uniref:Uncharacterized protein n=1 Tax=Araneus ventricosus TaxID=182803 RepID=A0A4Y2J2A0_ARAVE|nr:hypothetical protein AVEN_145080-1 [Araneus ventricosus]
MSFVIFEATEVLFCNALRHFRSYKRAVLQCPSPFSKLQKGYFAMPFAILKPQKGYFLMPFVIFKTEGDEDSTRADISFSKLLRYAIRGGLILAGLDLRESFKEIVF